MGPLLLVVALSAERRAVQAALQDPQPDRVASYPLIRSRFGSQAIWVLQAGLGRSRAASAVRTITRMMSCEAVWSVGFAGGLANRLRPGTCCVPGAVLIPGSSVPLTPDPRSAAVCQACHAAGLPTETGSLITMDAPVRTPEEKRRLAQQTGAVIVDMEAAGVAAAAQALGHPWLALKAVLDVSTDRLPRALAHAIRPSGDLSWSGLGRALWTLPALLQLGYSSHLAARSLSTALRPAVQAWTALTPS